MSFTSSMWQAANISNLCGMNEGVAAVKTKSSLPMYQDDMESKRKRNIHLVKNYDGDDHRAHWEHWHRKTLAKGIISIFLSIKLKLPKSDKSL